MKAKLSKRESTVLTCIKNGMKNKEISGFLGISDKSVSTYVLRIHTKLSVGVEKNRYALVMSAKRKGYI